MILLGIYNSIEVKSFSKRLTEEQLRKVKKNILEQKFSFLEKEAELINTEFIKIEQNIQMVQRQAEQLYSVPINHSLPMLSLKKEEQGYLWQPIHNDYSGMANVFVSSIASDSDTLKNDLQIATQLEPLLHQTVRNEPILKGVFFCHPESGFIIFPAINVPDEIKLGKLPSNLDVKQFEFFYIADESNNPARSVKWTSTYQDVTKWDYIITAAVPVYNDEGRFKGVVGADVPIESITNKFLNFHFEEPHAFAFIVDEKGNFIAGDQKNFNKIFSQRMSASTLTKLKNNENGQRTLTINGEKNHHMFASIPSSGWYLNFVTPETDIVEPILKESQIKTSDQLQRFYERFSWFLIICTIFLTCLSYLFSKTVTNPVKRLITAIKENTEGQYGRQIQVFSTDEIGSLTKTFNEMSMTIDELVEELHDRANILEDRVSDRTKDLQMMNNRLLETYEQLKTTEESRSELILQVSHDLKSPLTAIKGYLQVIKRYPLSQKEQDEYLDIILLQVNHIVTLIDDLFELASLDNTEILLEKEWTDLEFLINHSASLIKENSEQHHLLIQTSFEQDLPLLFIDIKKVNRALLNILSNAVKYAYFRDTINISIQVFKEPSHICISISDNGMGISEDSLFKIMEPFYREKRVRKANINGSGLGFSITKKIIEAHGGKILLSSKLDEGTTVKIFLPTGQAE